MRRFLEQATEDQVATLKQQLRALAKRHLVDGRYVLPCTFALATGRRNP